jgi:dephospho-CoA kinase
MFSVALTGGIGTGKTTVCQMFAEHGVPIIDADDIARELTIKGSPVLAEIAAAFGNEFIDETGQLMRDALRQHVFEQDEARKQLESILHPAIRQAMQQQLSRVDAPYCIMAIPLLVETGQVDLGDRVLVVDADETAQIKRVQERSHLSEEEISAIMAAQASRDARLAVADDVINNNSDLASLKEQVSSLHEKYLNLATTIE